MSEPVAPQWVDVEFVRFHGQASALRLVYEKQRRDIGLMISSADPSELALAIEQPAPEKPRKSIDDMTLTDYRRGCDKVMRSPWLPY